MGWIVILAVSCGLSIDMAVRHGSTYYAGLAALSGVAIGILLVKGLKKPKKKR